jgi:protein-S-isoprenylcysteine O-methyltransferase Ste14
MLSQRLTAVLLSLPLLVLISVSISYWITYNKQQKHDSGKQHIAYNKFFLALVAIGYFGIWPSWVGAIVLLFLDLYYVTLHFLLFSFPMMLFIEIVGLVTLYVGSLLFAWAICFAGKYLRPSTSGVPANQKLQQDGPLSIVRHPYYVSYVMILVGLALTLTTLLPLLLALFVFIGMGLTAKAEEEHLIILFGEKYQQYQQRVGRFLPKIYK